MSPEEKKAARRARRAKLGQDLFATQAERPFLFPPKFTFVFRAFSTIDGIGKALSEKYDLSRISQPYLRELANLRDGSVATSALREVGRRVGLRPKDVGQVVTQPRNVAAIAASVKRIEEGDVKLRVRTVEVEAMISRLEEKNGMAFCALGATVLLDLSLRATAGAITRVPLLIGAAKLGWEAYLALLRLRRLDEQQARFRNEGDDKYDDVDVYASDNRDLSATADEPSP